jgi:hypothetical protein
MKSFSVLKTNVGLMVQDTSSAFATLLGIWINNRYRDIVNSYDWEQLYHNQSITTTANTSAYPFDENTERLIYAVDITNDRPINIITEQDFLQNYGDTLTDTGESDTCFLASAPVRSQPGSGEALIVKSSSASDTTQTILVRGITSTTNEVYESLSLSGTTAVTATNSYTEILGLSKSLATVGKVKIYENDGTTLIAEMSPESLVSRYKLINLYPIPSGAVTVQLRSKRKVLPLSQNYDYPIIEDIADVIEFGVQADAWKYKRQFSKGNAFETQYQIAKMDRIHREVAQPGIVHQFQAEPLNRDEGILS